MEPSVFVLVALAVPIALLYRRVVALEEQVARLSGAPDRLVAEVTALRNATGYAGTPAPTPDAPVSERPALRDAPDPADVPASPSDTRRAQTTALRDASRPGPRFDGGNDADTAESIAAPPAPPSFESLVGARLPVWVGGAALVVAGFFLVRYAIDAGWLGPVTRVLLAAAFSALLLAAGEASRRLPATRDDARIAQVLVGAAVATAYGTLYAAARADLLGATIGFGLMALVTAGALLLSIRHGAPTAIMALIGGFSAPLVAGFDADGIGWLLAWLALFIAALFGLAARQGWRWLSIAAIVAGFGWANLALVLLSGEGVAPIAGFALLLAIGASLVVRAPGPLLRAAPMIAGALQLLLLAPALQYDALAWTYYLTLPLAAILLARRDAALLPAAIAAGVMAVLLVAAAGFADAPTAQPAALLATVLIAGAGILWSAPGTSWTILALIGLAAPLALRIGGDGRAPLELAAAAAAAALAWRGGAPLALRGGIVAGLLLATVAIVATVPQAWAPLALAPLLATVLIRTSDPVAQRLPALVPLAMLLLAYASLAQFGVALANSLWGEELIYPLLPPPGEVLQQIAAPAAIVAAIFHLRPAAFGTWRRPVATGLALATLLTAYILAKQPFAIATPEAFVATGFIERAIITLAIAAVAVLRRSPALMILALARFAWFDLLLLGPVFAPQRAPAALLLPAALAWAAHRFGWRPARDALTLVAVVALVRQLTHGSILTGPLGATENALYSAAFLILALVWIWRASRRTGLVLLTLVTLKVFLLDVAALGGLLRILSLIGLGLALIGLGWAWRRFVTPAGSGPPAG